MVYEMRVHTNETRRIVKTLTSRLTYLWGLGEGLKNKDYYVLGRSFGTIFRYIATDDPAIEKEN